MPPHVSLPSRWGIGGAIVESHLEGQSEPIAALPSDVSHCAVMKHRQAAYQEIEPR